MTRTECLVILRRECPLSWASVKWLPTDKLITITRGVLNGREAFRMGVNGVGDSGNNKQEQQ
jgi:hypothetical protein